MTGICSSPLARYADQWHTGAMTAKRLKRPYAFFDFGLMTAKVIGTAFGFLANYAGRQFLVFSAKPRLAPLSVLLKRDRS
jgi:hypothetical protein